MILPKNKKKTTEVSLGTAYDINKNLVKKYEHELTDEDLCERETEIDDFLREKDDNYYMLLCHDRRDYTIFHTADKSHSLFTDLKECLVNRGKIYAIDETEDGCAFEIWLMIDDEPYCYYFFPYGNAVVEY